MTREEEKIFAGELFCPGDPELKDIKMRTHNLNIDYNRLYEDQTEERNRILHEILGAIGEGTFLQGPITFHYGRVTGIIRTRFLQADFRRYFVKILENPQRIFCVLCLVSSKILTVKNLRPEDEVFLLDFWG